MSEATPQKRVLPARERADSAAKRRASLPVVPTTPATEPRQKRKYTKRGSLNKPTTSATGTPAPSTPVEENLPTKVQTSTPLPSMSQKQAEKLSNKEYHSIAESAVLTASLHRSRMQWLCEGILKRYWTKPVKRKGVIEQPPGNPDAKTMSKLGNATMTIEPHVFDVTFYTVRDPTSIPLPYYRHPNQHTTKQPNSTLPPAVSAQPSPQRQDKPPTTSPRTIPTSVTNPATTGGIVTVKREAPTTQTRPTMLSTSAPGTPTPPYPVAHPPTQSVAPAPPGDGPSKPATDPVIQMLAARAATDNRLKELMKVVAMSQATVEQLKEFQSHIDEFNKTIKQQEAKKAEGEKTKPSPAPATAAHPATYSAPPSRPHPGPPTSMGGPTHMAPPSYAAYPPPRAEPFIKHIVVEFHSAASVSQGASTDRWLFPEHAILDIRSGGMEMVASFLAVRKGEDILKRHGVDPDGDGNLRQKFTPGVEYYQPVTIFIKATQHKTVETIARAARPLPECHSHIKEVMEKKTRAPQEYLVHRLPRERVLTETGVGDFVDSAVEMSNDEDDELRDVYST